jgi:cGMP-dependent protein kinase
VILKKKTDLSKHVTEGHLAVNGNGKRFGRIVRKDLKKLGLIGCGAFGVVEMVEHVKSGNTYALKGISKGYIAKTSMEKSVMTEKNVQILCNDSDFIIRLYETFNGNQSLYFLLELAIGGELYTIYHRKALYGLEKYAKFYVAGVVLAFEHMHKKKVLYRDLKPENILLNEMGQCKLCDMGLAKVVVGKTFTTCGTPDYFAPELISAIGHTLAVDWWTLGILTFELMAGHAPFESVQPLKIYEKVKKGIARIGFPANMRGACEDFVKGHCQQEPTARIPMRRGGVENTKMHKWYEGFNWNAMKELTMDPPYKPNVKDARDASAFHAKKADLPPVLEYRDKGDGWDADFATST